MAAPSCGVGEMRESLLFPLCAAVGCRSALAQGALSVEFPIASKPLPAAPALKAALAGKTFNVDLADGTRWRLEYKANGYFFLNTSTGFNGTGDWRADDERLCTACAAARCRATKCATPAARCNSSVTAAR